MPSLVIDRQRIELEYETDCIVVRPQDEPPRSIPLSGLDRVLCMHNTRLSTQLMGQCHSRGIDIIVLNGRSDERSFALYADSQTQSARRLAQYKLAAHPATCLPLAQRLVRHKIAVGIALMNKAAPGWRTEPTSPERLNLTARARQVMDCTSLDSLRGLEGLAQRTLFAWWRKQLPEALGFTQRLRRPPPDPVNALLSLAYTFVFHEAVRQCKAQQVDPWLGIYHQPSWARQSFACDIMEPLRPLVEAWVVRLFVEGQLDRRHFSHANGACQLGKAGREIVYQAWHDQQHRWGRRLAGYIRVFCRVLDQANQGETGK